VDSKIKFKEFGKQPQCINDMSFWLPQEAQYESNDFYDLDIYKGGNFVEQVEAFFSLQRDDVFFNK
jgi:phenylalanyl-tRNA synthetase alpha chain